MPLCRRLINSHRACLGTFVVVFVANPVSSFNHSPVMGQPGRKLHVGWKVATLSTSRKGPVKTGTPRAHCQDENGLPNRKMSLRANMIHCSASIPGLKNRREVKTCSLGPDPFNRQEKPMSSESLLPERIGG